MPLAQYKAEFIEFKQNINLYIMDIKLYKIRIYMLIFS